VCMCVCLRVCVCVWVCSCGGVRASPPCPLAFITPTTPSLPHRAPSPAPPPRSLCQHSHTLHSLLGLSDVKLKHELSALVDTDLWVRRSRALTLAAPWVLRTSMPLRAVTPATLSGLYSVHPVLSPPLIGTRLTPTSSAPPPRSLCSPTAPPLLPHRAPSASRCGASPT